MGYSRQESRRTGVAAPGPHDLLRCSRLHPCLGDTTTAYETMQVEPLEERALEVPAVQATDAGCSERLRTHFRDIAPGEVFNPVTRFFGYKTKRS